MEAGGEISSPAGAQGVRLRDQQGGTGYKPADRQDAAGPLGGEIKPKLEMMKRIHRLLPSDDKVAQTKFLKTCL